MSAFSHEWFASILWGAWLQTVGPALIILFAPAIAFLAGAMTRLAGWMTLFGASVLMTVSMIEITFYIGALEGDPAQIGLVSLGLIHAVQHLYFVVVAPALFLPLGVVILGSTVLPRVLGLPRAGPGGHLRGAGCRPPLHARPAGAGAGDRRRPGGLVAGRRRHAHRSRTSAADDGLEVAGSWPPVLPDDARAPYRTDSREGRG